MPTPEELAEDTGIYLLPRPFFEAVVRDDLVFVAGPRRAWVHRIRAPAVDWARAEARRRGLEAVHWWVGWSPPAGIVDELVAQGLEIDADEPVFAGLTCAREPPAAPHVDVRPLRTVADYLEALAADDQVWGVSPEERERTRAFEVERFEQDERSGVVHHWAAYDDGRPVGFARAVDMADGVALMGGSVLPSHRGRGVYRALVHARWRHAAGRGTPLLVVQAGRMSAPVLAGLGFVRHGSLLALVDRL